MEKRIDSKKIMLQNGVLLGLVMVLISVISYVSGVQLSKNTILQSVISILSFVAMISFIVLGIRKVKVENQGFISLSQALKIGLGISVIAGIIIGIYQVIFLQYIAPEFSEQLSMIQREAMLETNPNLTQNQLDKAIEITKKFSSPWMQFAFAVIGNLFFGFIISLIAGLVMRREEPQEV